MVRNYVSKNKRGVWKIDTMKAASNAVLNQRVSLKKAAKLRVSSTKDNAKATSKEGRVHKKAAWTTNCAHRGTGD